METMACPRCQMPLTATSEMAGKKVRCPVCATTFELSATGVPMAPAEDEAPRPSPLPAESGLDDEDATESLGRLRQHLDMDPAWRSTRSGIQAIYFALLLSAGMLIVTTPLFLGSRHVFDIVPLICLGIVGIVGALITFLIGLILCIATPDPRAKAMVAGTLICAFAFVVVFIGTFVLRPSQQQEALALLGFLVVMPLLGSILLVQFLKRIAEAIGKEVLVRNLTRFQAYQIAWMVVSGITLGGTLAIQLDMGGRVAAPIADDFLQVALRVTGAVIGGIGGIIYLTWLVILLARTRDAVDEALDGPVGRDG